LKNFSYLSVEVDTRPQIVHNLEIAGAHTYFAGELEAWGHNRILGYGRKKGGGGKQQWFRKCDGQYVGKDEVKMAGQMDLGDFGSGFQRGYDGMIGNPTRESAAKTCGNVVGLITRFISRNN
jgi:hypothetical protein